MNVVVVCIDTLRWDHLAHNGQKDIITPNIDRFAERATIFDRCLIGSFPTVPHRMDCFTGMNNFPLYDWQPLPDELVTVTEVLNEAGYHTACVSDTTNYVHMNVTRGMKEIEVTLQPPADAPKPEEIPFPVPKENIRQQGQERQPQMARAAHFKHESDWWVAKTMTRAADWLQDNAKREKWFLWVDTFEVHEVWHTPKYLIDLYDDPNYDGLDYDFPNYSYTDIYQKHELHRLQARYAAEVTLMDRWVGHLLDQIDLMQQWDHTMVVFTSDHGMYIGEHKRTGKHTVRGAEDPWPLYEEITHVPLLVWYPKKGMKKRVKALAQPADLMPTILDATKVKGPKVYGKSWLPLMNDKTKKNWDVVFSSKHGAKDMRLDLCPSWLTVTSSKWAYVCEEPGHRPELYDLKADPKQKRNLARKRPDVCKKLQRAATDFLREQGAAEEYVARY